MATVKSKIISKGTVTSAQNAPKLENQAARAKILENADTKENFDEDEENTKDEEKFEKVKINVDHEKLVCLLADALDKRYALATVRSKIISRGIHRTAQIGPSFENQDVRAKILTPKLTPIKSSRMLKRTLRTKKSSKKTKIMSTTRNLFAP